MDETKFSAANVNLPQLSTRPYFRYGIDVQKKWGDRFSGYLQAMLRNGGRTGIALSAGFRWALGKDVTNGNLKQTNNSIPELPKTKIELSSTSK